MEGRKRKEGKVADAGRDERKKERIPEWPGKGKGSRRGKKESK